ncbi:DNA-formamidopyrimidine glycosylase [Bacillus changyiensis]|uniref:DNA-formamidopyrimidine glycosylase n=1 Tax=Bacillus changyiensis TaxID=3004103 RepID=UPI0022E30080|nr:DNA-formamidopyrimidine glycosylase [Bacillus changyiensis]MDA1477577.1 DNA-formamidopyrimidine glycosylase [Bacillus changyiensis]
MPELPEVETVRRTLTGLVKGKTIATIEIKWANIIKRPADPEEFARLLVGETIESIDRRGKFLLFHFGHCVMVSHLRMEGKYGLHQQDEPLDKHVHVIFKFTDGTELRYRDVRKFGTMHLFKPGEERTELPLCQLGPEPFSDEFTIRYLRERLSKTNRSVKTALLDQRTVVGLGNIYVDEALFRAGIHPETNANQLTYKQTECLHEQIIQTLKEAVEAGGSTVRSYLNSQGEIGMFQLRLFVYGRKDEPCKKCGTVIRKTVVGGRGTHFCIKCQKK